MCGNLLFVNTVLCLCVIVVAGCGIVSNRVQTRVRKGQQRLIDAYRRELDAQHTLIVSLRELLTEKQLLLDERVKQLKMYRAPPFHGVPMGSDWFPPPPAPVEITEDMRFKAVHRHSEPMDEHSVDAAGNKIFTPSKCGMAGFFGHELVDKGEALPDGSVVLFDDSPRSPDEELERIKALGWRDREHLAEARRNGWECNDPGCKACETRCDQLAARNREPK